MDPEREKAFTDMTGRHPVLAKAYLEFLQNYPPDELKKILETRKYIDEIGAEYLASTVITRLDTRLGVLGVREKFKGEIERLKAFVKEKPYSRMHLDVIKQVFELNCGQEFLGKLESNSKETQEITRSVWKDAIDRMHFLPMESGENVVEFSQDSVPSLLGLKDIKMTRVGSLQDWSISVVFVFDNTNFELYTVLTKDGKLEFKAPVEQEMRGLYTMLNHIAVLTFHDLVVQENKQTERRSRVRSEVPIQQESQTARPERGNKQTAEEVIQSRESHPSTLPRVNQLTQQDTQLISDVYEATNHPPRSVELHRSQLGRRKNYLAAVALYQETIYQSNVSRNEITAAKELLDEARRRMYKISEQKRLSIPAKLPLETFQDPATKEQLYLETWVVQHTSPRPTEEELKSPAKLYQRYYRNSSALASLDQMKPWFVGQ